MTQTVKYAAIGISIFLLLGTIVLSAIGIPAPSVEIQKTIPHEKIFKR